MSIPARTFTFDVPTNVVVRIQATSAAEAEARLAELKGHEIGLQLANLPDRPAGVEVSSFHHEGGGRLSMVDDVAVEDLCGEECLNTVDGMYDGQCEACWMASGAAAEGDALDGVTDPEEKPQGAVSLPRDRHGRFTPATSLTHP